MIGLGGRRTDASRRRRLPPLARVLILGLALLACGALGWVWYRDSSLVRVRQVSVTGVSGPDARQIRGALSAAALRMTTLAVDRARLQAAVSRYRYVHSLKVFAIGAHRLRIEVDERVPVAYVQAGGLRLPADGAGLLLPSTTATAASLPTVPAVGLRPGASLRPLQSITAPATRAVLAVLAAAPYAMLGHVQRATWSAEHGVVVFLRRGPELYFGPARELAAKWGSVVSVLQAQGSAGAGYIDVSDPQRPAAGFQVSSATAATFGLAGGG